MACGATLKRSRDFDPLMSPASPKRRRCVPVSPSPRKYLRMEPSPFDEPSSRFTAGEDGRLPLSLSLSPYLCLSLFLSLILSLSLSPYLHLSLLHLISISPYLPPHLSLPLLSVSGSLSRSLSQFVCFPISPTLTRHRTSVI